MRYELFPYQELAACNVLKSLGNASTISKSIGPTSFALTACTGAGKTVIASAVIESLFNGNDTWGVAGDESAAVLWLTDDESLNLQTLKRLATSSDLRPDQLVAIDSPDFPEDLSRHRVYFLNVQKLHDGSTSYTKPSDTRPWSLWDTITRTIDNPHTTLYLVLDEAHKGMKSSAAKATTVLRLINGEGTRPPVPVVWGISATPERFLNAMKGAEGRNAQPNVTVSTADVQESGLLKDTIILTSPSEDGTFDTTLLSSAVTSLREQTERWETYCSEQRITPVVPLLVIQVGDKPSKDELSRILATVTDEWDVLTEDTIRNVFGEHTDISANGMTIRYIEPDAVQDNTKVRVLLAKNAVTTGWDCPRAEILFSMRGSKDRTVITQFLGRMVRTPLAYRVPDDDLLNSVTCVLPKFDTDTVNDVAEDLTNRAFDASGGMSDGEGRQKVVRNPVTLTRNASLPAGVFDVIESLPTEPRGVPVRTQPIPNLFAAASLFTDVKAVPCAHKTAVKRLLGALDSVASEFSDELAELVNNIETADVTTVSVGMNSDETSKKDNTLKADSRAIEADFRDATRVMTSEVAVQYQKKVASEPDGDVLTAKIQTAAIARIPVTVERLNEAAAKLTREWVDAHADTVKLNGDPNLLRELDQVSASADAPVDKKVSLPKNRVENKTGKDTWDRHVLSDDAGKFPFKPSSGPERDVLETELARIGTGKVVAWYRNPGNAVESALQIPYKTPDGRETTTQPDYIFVQQSGSVDYVVSVVDPHGSHYRGGMERLRGIADFVEKYEGVFQRFVCVTWNSKKQLVRLDMHKSEVREAVREATDEVALFDGPLAKAYG